MRLRLLALSVLVFVASLPAAAQETAALVAATQPDDRAGAPSAPDETQEAIARLLSEEQELKSANDKLKTELKVLRAVQSKTNEDIAALKAYTNYGSTKTDGILLMLCSVAGFVALLLFVVGRLSRQRHQREEETS